MLKDMMIGQYYPGDSLFYRLDPRTKVLGLLFILTTVFMADSVISYSIVTGVCAVLIAMSGVPFRMVLKSVKPLLWILIFTVIVHIFSTPGTQVAKVWVFTITEEGIQRAVYMSIRLVLLLMMSSLLTFTTTPITLTDAIEKLLLPFKKIGVPAHELAMMMTIALRFIPTLLEETDRIMKAQKARGADFSSGGVKKRLKSLVPLLVPLFISAFRRADELAAAMEARCYHGGEQRTRMNVLKVKRRDYAAGICIGLFFAVMLIVRFNGW